MDPFRSPEDHLAEELQRLELLLRRQIVRFRAANQLTEDHFRGLYIPDELADALLNPADASSVGRVLQDLNQQIAKATKRLDDRLQAAEPGAELPWVRLARSFGLDRYDLDAVLMALGPELDLRFETLFAYVQNDVTKKRPTVNLALALHWSRIEDRIQQRRRFETGAPLIDHQILSLVGDSQDPHPPLAARYLKVDEAILQFLLGRRRSERLVAPRVGVEELLGPSSLRRRAEALIQVARDEPVLVVLHGPGEADGQSVAEAVCQGLGCDLIVVREPGLQADAAVRSTLRRHLRDARLQRAALFVEILEGDVTTVLQAAAEELPALESPLFVRTLRPWHVPTEWPDVFSASVELDAPTYALRAQMWERAFDAGRVSNAGIELASLSSKFGLTREQMERSVRQAHNAARLQGEPLSVEHVEEAARQQGIHKLHDFAHRVESRFGWDDIVLPQRARQHLREVFHSVQYRHVVYSQWGFQERLSLSKGVNVLFAGPSGTGKTMAASILGNALGLELYKVNLATLVSKFIGDTEKNLDRVFAEARASNAILFFDEADALFGKRSEVKDAHDRYANIEVAYLLQKVEEDEHESVVILATNLHKNMDDAFARRLHHVVEFPFPDAQYREQIWRRLFPGNVHLADDVNLPFLAQQFELAGGGIRNVALTAAFLAAKDGRDIEMSDLIYGIARELQKAGRLPARSDFREYYESIRSVVGNGRS